ncbi:hypothetical protein M2137_002932 [Parabacteroides sp. PFB2-10]|uniref:hypothetical protein n=1 Tax=Parabacteroides sp. PFB2-10 TaxID=1742405 RepID=UPI0024765E54|nr:hypothetical protein [Parabacteroides sp. PFB2-10]MDH6314138.1 hypothetical protein [Parabacteroides sp. PFB2-10]MDL2245530.1 hypothetical protein [Parabacteroides sp. OttesenSCG-928-J18]
MNDKQMDELIDQALQEEQALPEGLSERLENYIDRLDKAEKRVSMRKRSVYWMVGVAASLLIGVALFFPTETIETKPTTADTFSDPEEAAVVAGEALAFLSLQFNKGVNQLEEAKQEVERVNEIVNKQFKEISK